MLFMLSVSKFNSCPGVVCEEDLAVDAPVLLFTGKMGVVFDRMTSFPQLSCEGVPWLKAPVIVFPYSLVNFVPFTVQTTPAGINRQSGLVMT